MLPNFKNTKNLFAFLFFKKECWTFKNSSIKLKTFSFVPVKKVLAFSLIELMISLIVISTVTAAFTPVITKKLKSSGVTVGGLTSRNPFENVKLGKDECSSGLAALGVTIANNNCTMCKLDSNQPVCLACSDMSCSANQFENTADCTCQNCSIVYDSKCYKCDIKGCKICSAGYYLEGSGTSAACKSVDSYPGCDSNPCYTDPDGVPPVVKPTPCPKGSICDGGVKTDCVTPELTHKLCSGGIATDCPTGKKCNNGIVTECAAHKMCSNGVETDCPVGKKCDNGIASDCSLNKKCSGGQEYPCGQYKLCSNGVETDCPEGKKCDGGIASPCSSNKKCSGGVETNCPDGSICSNGLETKCATPELTHKWCTGGTANTCTAGYTCDNGIRSTSKCNTTGYYCLNGIKSSCVSKTPNCAACNNETGTCTTCNSGYYKTGSNTCTSCSVIMGCSTCTSSTSCSKCTGSYYLNGTTCSSCPSNGSCNGTSSWSCTSTYFKSGSSCLKCSDYMTGCAECSSDTVCTKCITGYTKSGNKCVADCPNAGGFTGCKEVRGYIYKPSCNWVTLCYECCSGYTPVVIGTYCTYSATMYCQNAEPCSNSNAYQCTK